MVLSPDVSARRLNAAAKLLAIAQTILCLIFCGILAVIPWSFGGNGPEGYYWIVWSGRLCLLPLALWGASRALDRRLPGVELWVPVICWALLAGQVMISLHNPSHETQPPWVGDGFTPIPHRENLPSTSFEGSTLADGNLWIALGLFALSARCVGLSQRMLRRLLWAFVINATVLTLIGIPFKFSDEPMILGKWPVQEKYYYSTFLYHNHWCAYALLGLASAVALFDSSKNVGARVGLVFIAVTIMASAPLSTSRLGTLAMLAFGGAILVLFFLRKKSPDQVQPRLAIGIIAAAVLGLAVIGGGLTYFYKIRKVTRGDRTWSALLHSNPFGLRQTFVEDTIPMLKKKPWFGWGLGGYGAAFRFYQRAETRVVHNQGRITLYDHIHNDWLERLTELGVIGFGLLLVPGIVWTKQAFAAGPRPRLELWLFTGCVGIMIFALGDMAFCNNTVAAAFALLFGLSTRTLAPKSGCP